MPIRVDKFIGKKSYSSHSVIKKILQVNANWGYFLSASCTMDANSPLSGRRFHTEPKKQERKEKEKRSNGERGGAYEWERERENWRKSVQRAFGRSGSQERRENSLLFSSVQRNVNDTSVKWAPLQWQKCISISLFLSLFTGALTSKWQPITT